MSVQQVFDASLTADRTFSLRGELDVATVPILLDAVDEALADGGDLTLDLADLTLLDSTGVGAILRIAQALDDRILRLQGPGGEVRKVRELVGIDGHPRLRIEYQTPAATR